MTTTAARKVLVVAGLGAGQGTGASAARLFSKAGYSVALIARGADTVNKVAQELNAAGGEASPFPIESYTTQNINSAWDAIRSKYPSPNYAISAAVFNVAHGVWKPFLDIAPTDIQQSLQVVEAGFAFSRGAVLAFKDNEISEPTGKRGTLIFTGATASLRGNPTTSAFAAGKFGIRALSQSLAKEFGKQNIHVAHAIIDGGILTERFAAMRPGLENNLDARLSPDSIASSYLYLVNQDRTAWTWELDLRPAHEKW